MIRKLKGLKWFFEGRDFAALDAEQLEKFVVESLCLALFVVRVF